MWGLYEQKPALETHLSVVRFLFLTEKLVAILAFFARARDKLLRSARSLLYEQKPEVL